MGLSVCRLGGPRFSSLLRTAFHSIRIPLLAPSWQQQQSPLLSSPTFLPATAKTATTRTTEQLFFPSSLPRPPSHRPRPAAEGDLDFFTSAGPSVRPMALSLSYLAVCAPAGALLE